MTLPSATLTNVPPEGQIAATAPANVAVFLGCSSKGPLLTPTPFGSQNVTGAEAIFGAGPLTREGGYVAAKVPVQTVSIRLPATAHAATSSTPVVTKNSSSDWTTTMSGSIVAGVDGALTFTVGGTTGTSGIKYTLSANGGVTTGAETSLGTATTITLPDGRTMDLGSTKTITAGDTMEWWTQPASASILPTTITRVASSTSVPVFSGTPNDRYEIAVEAVTGGTVGVAGITVRYSLDYKAGAGRSWSKVIALPLSGALVLSDGTVGDSTGITVTFGAGTVDALDRVEADTTAPVYQWSDASAALDALRNWRGEWTFIHCTGYLSRAFRDSLEAKLQTFAASGRYTWGTGTARDRIAGETTTARDNVAGDLAWSGRLATEWAGSAGTRTPWCAGSERVTCPRTGRRVRRPAALAYVPRIIGITPDTDPGDRTLPNGGALSADVTIHDPDNGQLVEHDARTNTSLFDLGFNVLRTWFGESGLEPGVYPARGNLMAPDGEIQRWTHMRIQCLASAAELAAMSRLMLSKFGVWPSTVRAPYVAGNIMEWDLKNMRQQLFLAVFNAVGSYVSAPLSGGIVVEIDPTPIEVNGDTVVKQSTKLVTKRTLEQFVGHLGYVMPRAAFVPAT